MNNISEQINQFLFPPSLNNISIQSDQDPVSKLLSSLHSSRGIEVNLKSKDDVFIEDFFQGKRTNSINVNVDKDLKIFSKPSKIPDIFSNKRQNNFPTQQQKVILSKLKILLALQFCPLIS